MNFGCNQAFLTPYNAGLVVGKFLKNYEQDVQTFSEIIKMINRLEDGFEIKDYFEKPNHVEFKKYFINKNVDETAVKRLSETGKNDELYNIMIDGDEKEEKIEFLEWDDFFWGVYEGWSK